jgi:hypothetical protein
MKQQDKAVDSRTNRRGFLKNGMLVGAETASSGLLLNGRLFAFDQDAPGPPPSKDDINILRFLNAVEQVEADLWRQYSELGGTQDSEIPGAGGNPAYTGALELLDGDMAQYIHDNTDDEISHAAFLKAYLESIGSDAVDLSKYANLRGSQAQGALNIGRLTNLMQLTVDTSFWSRYRSITNPDVDEGAAFVQAVPSLNMGQHTAIPRTDNDTAGSNAATTTFTTHLQAIAFTAGFHFAFIEQGGTSLYPTLALQVTNLEVLRILLSIGPSETMHFQTWQDKAGNALPITDTDVGFPGSTGATVTFTDLTQAKGETQPESLNGDTLQANLIMPEPAHFLNPTFPPVAIIRPTSTKNSGAVAAVQALVQDGLFRGQAPANNPEIVQVLMGLAQLADAARRTG